MKAKKYMYKPKRELTAQKLKFYQNILISGPPVTKLNLINCNHFITTLIVLFCSVESFYPI